MASVDELLMPSALVPISRLPQAFRNHAETVRHLSGSGAAAHVWEAAAVEVEARLREAILEPLLLDVAAAESGYSLGHLQRKLREGALPNSGTNAEPRVLRMHLPRKPGFGVDAGAIQTASSRTQAARAVIEGEE